MSATVENDGAFKMFMTGVWNMDLMDNSQSVVKCAGKTPDVYGKNAKEQWKYDMHRSLFGKLDNTPMTHSGKAQDLYRPARGQQQKEPVSSQMQAAGSRAWGDV